jgi:hypothetical protein
VYFTRCGFAPAMVNPGISLVAVYEITQTKRGFFAGLMIADLVNADISFI